MIKRHIDAKLLISKKIKNIDKAEDKLEFLKINIVKIIIVLNFIHENRDYILFIKEKLYLLDLLKLIGFYHGHSLLGIANPYFIDITSDNRLVNNNLILEKFCDFVFLTNIINKCSIKIPGITRGLISPEYYLRNEINQKDIKQHDYFGYGAILTYIKYDFPILEYKQHEINEWIEYHIIEQLKVKITYINSLKTLDNNFIEFINYLINPYVNERFKYEGIYRNKWRIQNLKDINIISYIYEGNEEKQIMEIKKIGFLNDIVNKKGKEKKKLFRINEF